jgi:radical SAM protein with 4Fe4S-binding SPASM domain
MNFNEKEFDRVFEDSFVLNKLGIDIVHGCQLRCVGCPNSTLKPKIKKISVTDFKKVIDNINVRHVNLFRLFNFGEPLLHEELPSLLNILNNRKFSISNIELSTNGQYHDFPILEEAIKQRIINTINVSCDGDGTAADYERLRPPSRWSKFITFVEKLSELREKFDPNLTIMTRTICEDTESQARWEKILKPLGFNIEFRGWIYMPESSVNMTGIDVKAKEGICSFLKDSSRLYVDYDGTIVPCCVHPAAGNLGNLLDCKLSRIISGEKKIMFLKKMKDERLNMPICNQCSL